VVLQLIQHHLIGTLTLLIAIRVELIFVSHVAALAWLSEVHPILLLLVNLSLKIKLLIKLLSVVDDFIGGPCWVLMIHF